MATKRRRQVTYIDDENIQRINSLKKLGILSKYLNWTLQNEDNLKDFMLEYVYNQKDT